MSHHQFLRKDKDGNYRWFDACERRDHIIPANDIPVSVGGKATTSKSLGVSPQFIADRNRFFEKEGITGARHLPNGHLQMDNRQARNEVLKSLGYQDNDGGYGDWCGH